MRIRVGPWTGSMDRVHGVVHGPGPSGGPWTPVHVLYMSPFVKSVSSNQWKKRQRYTSPKTIVRFFSLGYIWKNTSWDSGAKKCLSCLWKPCLSQKSATGFSAKSLVKILGINKKRRRSYKKAPSIYRIACLEAIVPLY